MSNFATQKEPSATRHGRANRAARLRSRPEPQGRLSERLQAALSGTADELDLELDRELESILATAQNSDWGEMIAKADGVSIDDLVADIEGSDEQTSF